MTEMFKSGKITFVLDGGAGSSSKGIRGAYIWKHMCNEDTAFAVNSFMTNAAHTITHDNGQEFIHQCLSSITSLGNYDKQYMSPGCVFSESEILEEIATHHVASSKLGIHPNASIVTRADVDYECGRVDFEGRRNDELGSANLNIGSTLHGVGAARARRVLRRPDAKLARDLNSLKPYLCKTEKEIMSRLDCNQSGLGEIAQGYQLSLFSDFWPKTTSRNCTVSAFLDDSMLPPSVVGPVVVNFRTFPIRVNNNKYVRTSDRKILTWDEYNTTPLSDRHIVQGDSGGFYSDQKELTWEQISDYAGEPISECTSLTKLPRRVFSFSRDNLKEALRFNNTGDDVYISINFMNYVDSSVKGQRTVDKVLTPKVMAWLKKNVLSDDVKNYCKLHDINLSGLFIGTWKTVDDSVFINKSEMFGL